MKHSDHLTPEPETKQICWQASVAPLQGAGWIVTLMDARSQALLAIEVFENAPGAEKVWQMLVEMLRAAEERGQKPVLVEMEPGWLLQALGERMQAAGVAAQAGGSSRAGLMADSLTSSVEADIHAAGGASPGLKTFEDLPALLATGEISPRAVRAFFHAAYRFYKNAPWNEVDEGEAIAIRIDPSGQHGFLILLGQTGIETGLAIYSAWEDTLPVAEGNSPLDHPSEAGLLALIFEAAAALPPADRTAIRRNRWPVAGARAYPLPLLVTSGGMQRPDAEALVFLEATLNALPDFVQGELPAVLDGDKTETLAEYEVETSQGSVRVTLSYPAGSQTGSETDWQSDPELSGDEKQALTLAHAAWEAVDETQRIQLAHEALALSANAVEAYLTLAEEAEYPQETLAWLEKAVTFGEQSVLAAQDSLQNTAYDRPKHPGNTGLWSRRSARPYLRALQAKAETLEQLGRGAAALEVYQDLLQLNPADHAGARYPALALLLRLNRDADAAALIERYAEDDSPDWAFARALIAFRTRVDAQSARQTLEHAARQHPQVVAFLTGAAGLLADPDEASSQAEADAAAYALRAYPIWWSTPGAIDWLRSL